MTDEIQQREKLSALDRKITDVFPGFTVRKDLVNKVKGNALVPSYVLEYLLSSYATTTDSATIDSGVERVRTILAENYVHREETNLIQSKIRERGSYRIIDRVQVSLNEKLDQYEATFSNLGISQVVVDTAIVKKNPKLLVTGIWCMCQIGYAYSGDPREVPWQLLKLQPVQMSHDDRENYVRLRPQFTDGEWIDLLMQSVGFNPNIFSPRAKLLHLVRMIPFVERNYNLIELGPKGTGKSHIYSEFSPHGMLISGGEVTVAKLFVNNSNGRIGLVGYWDTVAFDEFAGKSKKTGRDLVDIMKNYMANKSFSRGVETLQGEASMVFVGNTSHNVPYMLKNSDLFEELPNQYHDPAFLDRIHCYLPGWEFEQIRSEMFTGGYGFVVDYLAEILHNLRDVDYGSELEKYFTLSATLSTRDKDGVKKTFSGLMKLIYPDGNATPERMEPLLRCAVEGRKRVKDQLCRIDPTMAEVDFSYTHAGSTDSIAVHTLEETDYPELYWRGKSVEGSNDASSSESAKETAPETVASGRQQNPKESSTIPEPSVTATDNPIVSSLIGRAALAAKPGHLGYSDDQRGVTYNKLFGPYMAGAKEITLKDAYIRKPYQIRNLVEFLETVFNYTNRTDEVHVHVITGHTDEHYIDAQVEQFDEVQSTFSQLGIRLTYEFDDSVHDRSIVTDTGWLIVPGRGLDIFQPFSDNNWFNPLTRQQKLRRVRAFEITYVRK
jgi:ATP-dependent Lon protease